MIVHVEITEAVTGVKVAGLSNIKGGNQHLTMSNKVKRVYHDGTGRLEEIEVDEPVFDDVSAYKELANVFKEAKVKLLKLLRR